MLFPTMSSYESQIIDFRSRKDKFFKTDPHNTPLTPTQVKKFKHLEYFPPNPELRLELELHDISDKEVVTMQTSDGMWRDYIKFGYFEFDVEGDKVQLYVYKSSEDDEYYFIPFKDATSGKETYGAGRYVEVEPLKNGKFLLDLNMAYNPYCAYNSNYSCPIPPRENWLKVPIRAGEKIFPGAVY